MAITDIQISEELETNAPSIKYSGNEGPKSPQEEQMMMMASVDNPFFRDSDADEHSFRMFGKPYKELNESELEEFQEEMMRLMNQFSGGPPLPQDPTTPVTPFAPKPTGPVLPDRQMAARGGIMGADGRTGFLFGGIKKRIRKLIPNEVAKVAEVAAPFVAPFNPLAAGLMSGIGGFDRTVSIGSSLKSGLMNYAMGQGARYLGGADFQRGFNPLGGFTPGTTGTGTFSKYFSKPTGEGGIKNLFKDKASVPIKQSDGTYKMSTFTDDFAPSGETGNKLFKPTSTYDAIKEDQLIFKPENLINETAGGELKSKIMEYVPTSLADLTNVKKLIGGAGIVTAATMLLGGGEDETVSAIMDRGEGMDVASIRTEVQEAFADKTGEKLAALRVKYPFLGRADTKDFAMGGRIGKAEGGLMDLGGMEKDYRAEGGFVPIGREEKADDVPARLSVNEFVFTADAVRNAGGGDIDKGAEVMENMMKHLEQGGQVSQESQGIQSLKIGGRVGFANGMSVDKDLLKKDAGMLGKLLTSLTPGGMIGKLAGAGAKKLSDVELETIIKVIAKSTPGGMVASKVAEVLIDRYGMSPEEAQMRVVNKLSPDANEGFKQPSGTSDEGYRMVGIESSAEDTSDIPIENRIRNFIEKGRIPGTRNPKFPINPFDPFPKPKLSPDATTLNPHQDISSIQTMEFRDRNGNGIEDRAEGIYLDRDIVPFDPDRNKRFLPRPSRKNRLEEMFETSERLREVIG